MKMTYKDSDIILLSVEVIVFFVFFLHIDIVKYQRSQYECVLLTDQSERNKSIHIKLKRRHLTMPTLYSCWIRCTSVPCGNIVKYVKFYEVRNIAGLKIEMWGGNAVSICDITAL